MGKAIVLADIKVKNPLKKITVIPEPTLVDTLYAKYLAASGRADNPEILNMIKELNDNDLFANMSEFYYLANPTNSINTAKFNIADGGATQLNVIGNPNITTKGYKSTSTDWFTTKPANLLLGITVLITMSEIVSPAFPAFDWGNGYSFLGLNQNGYASIGDYFVAGSEVSGLDKKTTHILKHNGGLKFNYRLRNFSKTVDSNLIGNNTPFGIGRRNVGNDDASGSTFKFYASYNTQLNESQVLKVKEIFEKYEILL